MDINKANPMNSYTNKSNIMNSYIHMFNTIIDSEIIGLRCYAETEEQRLKELFDEEQINKIKDEGEWEDYVIIREVSPYIFRSSFFVTCYSFIEYQLIDINDYLEKEYKYKLNLNYFGKRKNILLARTYLKKVANIDFPDTNDYFADNKDCWNRIIKFNTIRNNIVHNGGRLDQGDDNDNLKKIKSFIADNPSKISIGNYNRINLSKEFIFHVIDTIDSFFKVFFNIWGIWYNKIHGND